jgi:hypothetical protein
MISYFYNELSKRHTQLDEIDTMLDNMYDCRCGIMAPKQEKEICPRCGKVMCSMCKDHHGHISRLCWVDSVRVRRNKLAGYTIIEDIETGCSDIYY